MPTTFSLAWAQVRTCHRILRAPRASARRARADGLKQALPRRKQARSSWQPTIVAVSAEESAGRSEGSASSDRPRHRRRSRPGSSSRARTAGSASASRFLSSTSVPGLRRSSCCYAKDSADPRRL